MHPSNLQKVWRDGNPSSATGYPTEGKYPASYGKLQQRYAANQGEGAYAPKGAMLVWLQSCTPCIPPLGTCHLLIRRRGGGKHSNTYNSPSGVAFGGSDALVFPATHSIAEKPGQSICYVATFTCVCQQKICT